jgi:hypothetical protein
MCDDPCFSSHGLSWISTILLIFGAQLLSLCTRFWLAARACVLWLHNVYPVSCASCLHATCGQLGFGCGADNGSRNRRASLRARAQTGCGSRSSIRIRVPFALQFVAAGKLSSCRGVGGAHGCYLLRPNHHLCRYRNLSRASTLLLKLLGLRFLINRSAVRSWRRAPPYSLISVRAVCEIRTQARRPYSRDRIIEHHRSSRFAMMKDCDPGLFGGTCETRHLLIKHLHKYMF